MENGERNKEYSLVVRVLTKTNKGAKFRAFVCNFQQ
jgi:hypothetical protein